MEGNKTLMGDDPPNEDALWDNVQLTSELLSALAQLIPELHPEIECEPAVSSAFSSVSPIPVNSTNTSFDQSSELDEFIFLIPGQSRWYECQICQRAGQKKRFEQGDTLSTHIRGGQHQRELLRRRSVPTDKFALPPEIVRISDNDFTCEVCNCGTISGVESAQAHVRGVKHVKALGRRAPSVQNQFSTSFSTSSSSFC